MNEDITPTHAGPQPWGFWATIALCTLVLVGYMTIQIGSALAISIHYEGIQRQALVDSLSSGGAFSGFSFAASLVISSLCGCLLCVLLVKMRALTTREYLALRVPGGGQLARWGFYTVLVMLGFGLLSTAIGRPEVHGLWMQTYKSAGWLPLYWGAMVLAGPAFEEALFRGFMFEGLRGGRLGGAGTVIVTALAWAVIHLQYDLYDMANVFALGLLFGAARLRTGSLLVPLFMHCLNNLGSMVELAWHADKAPH